MNRKIDFLSHCVMIGLSIGVIAPALADTRIIINQNGALLDLPLGTGDCQINVSTGTAPVATLICPELDHPVSGTTTHTVQPNEWGGLITASGGGTVPIVLPAAPPRGQGSMVAISTDGSTGFTITAQSPATMQGSHYIANGVV